MVRVSKPGGTSTDEEFNFFIHAGPGFVYHENSLHDDELQETLAELRENGVAVPAAFHDVPQFSTSTFQTVRNALAASALLDDKLIELSETTPAQLEQLKFTTVHSIDEHGNEEKDILVRAPNVIVDSYDITDILVLAHNANACPVFIDPHHQNELRHRYETAQAPDELIVRLFPELGPVSSVKATFGAVSFAISSEVFDAGLLGKKTTSEIIRYRRNMADSRAKYVSSDLLELSQLIETSPWSDNAKREIEFYVMGKLKKDIAVSRINGAKSRGPVTDAGRQKSSRNSRRHCLYAKNIDDDIQVSSPVSDPQSPASELDLLEQAALDAHRDRMRIVFLETRIMTEEIARQRLIHPAESEIMLQAFAFSRLADETGTMHALYRCEGVAMRRWERAVQRLDRWRSRQPVLFPKAEIEKNEICETNLRNLEQPKQAYNLRVANHDKTNGANNVAAAHVHRSHRERPSPHYQTAHARPHPPVFQRHSSRRQSRRAFG